MLVAFFLVAILLERSLAADLESERRAQLVEQARGAGDWVGATRHPNRVAGRLAQVVQSEVVIFDRDDCVVGSSVPEHDPVRFGERRRDDGTRAGPAGVESGPCTAPEEVVAARSEGLGAAHRVRGEDALQYVAVPAEDGLVVRLARSDRDVAGPLSKMRLRLALAMVVALVLALGLALLASRLIARPLRTMAEGAAKIAEGDYEPHFPSLPKDEFGQLADVLSALAAKLKADIERIGKLEATRSDFVANVTHELRTPVAAIRGCAETLMEGNVDDGQRRHFIDLMQKHAERIGALVEGLLQLSKIEAEPKEDAPRTTVPLAEVLENVGDTLAQRARARHVTLALGAAHAPPVLGDETRLEQVLENLVDNAIKYGREGGRIAVETAASGDRVVVTVADDGPGIEAKHLPRLFERFYRVDAGRSRERGGAGLGLAIVKHLVESMGGSISVDSAVGRGTTFTLTLLRGGSLRPGPASSRPAASS